MFPSSSQASSRPACRLQAPLVQVANCSSWHWEFCCELLQAYILGRIGIFFMDMIWLLWLVIWKITIFNGKFHYKSPFSIAMLNYQRVYDSDSAMIYPQTRFWDHIQRKLPFCSENSSGSQIFTRMHPVPHLETLDWSYSTSNGFEPTNFTVKYSDETPWHEPPWLPNGSLECSIL